jgi:hypothetical protein
MNNPDHISEFRKKFLGLKYLNSLMWIRDGKIRIRDGKNWIRDKHPGSATLRRTMNRVDPDGSELFWKAESGSESESQFRSSKGVAEGSGRSHWRRGGSKMEPLRICIPSTADLHHFDKRGIRRRIKIKCRIRITVKRCIRIALK